MFRGILAFMQEYTEVQLKEHYDNFLSLLKSIFSGERLEKLLYLYDDDQFGLRLITAPASSKVHFHNAYVGGYLDHINNVYRASLGVKKLWEVMGATIDFTDEELAFSAIHHDLGKLGDKEQGEYYLPQDNDWYIKNRGEVFKFNSELQYMDVADRSLYILQQYQIKCTWRETLAIKLSDGLYNEANTSYLKNYNESHDLKSNLPRIIHYADYLACRVEYDRWNILKKS